MEDISMNESVVISSILVDTCGGQFPLNFEVEQGSTISNGDAVACYTNRTLNATEIGCHKEPIIASDFIGESSEIKVDAIVWKEADNSELLYKEVATDEEAYKLYNDYSFRCGFGTRKDRVNYRLGTKIVRNRHFLCSREGGKEEAKANPKVFTKLDGRTGCDAGIQFDVDRKTGMYVVVKHNMVHNHGPVPVGQRHMIRSHRKVAKEQFQMIKNMMDGGVGVADAVRVLRHEVQSFENLGFIQRDAYDAVAKDKKKKLDGCDSNQLIKYFSQRQVDSYDFFYELELNENNELINFFWRDARMRKDYECFGDLLVHDTTYRTNKYDMICAPFVGMNHHNRNVMFGIGFLLNETAESFVWLFNAFLRSMGGKHPITLMTDQSLAMAKAIRIIFPYSRHRLCTWHICENAKKNIRGLRALDGFNRLFDTVLKYTETPAEFEYFWKSMMSKYQCSENKWLQNLYEIRHMFSPAYSKDYFSGGILSSQRSESTNHSLGDRLKYTQGLCEFYRVFVDVVDEWREVENSDNYKSMTGNKYLAFAELPLLLHAKEIYTVSLYLLFEENFIKGASCHHRRLDSSKSPFIQYHVHRPSKDLILHTVAFNPFDWNVDCTCKYFGEMGMLCCHSLRIYHVNNVNKIPERYILGRWTKHAMCTRVHDDRETDSSIIQASAWRIQTIRNCIGLINFSQHDSIVRGVVDEGFKNMELKVKSLIGKFEESLSLEDVEDMLKPKIKDPPKKRKKGTKDERPKSIVEKERNKIKGWKKRAEKATTRNKTKAQEDVQEYMDYPSEGVLTHPTCSSSTLLDVYKHADSYSHDEYFDVNIAP